MKKFGKVLLGIIAFILVSSFILRMCNRGSKEETFTAKIKPETLTVSGDLSDYLQVVDNEYEVTKDMMYNSSVKLKVIKPYSGNLNNKTITLYLSLLGENGSPISEIEKLTPWGGEDNIISLLTKGSGEEIIRFTATSNFQKVDAGKVKKFTISSTVTEAEQRKSSQASAGEESTTSSSGPSEYDELLDSYEKLADDYIGIMSSMSKDDISGAVGNYASALKNTLEVEKKLKAAKAGGNMSADQIARMLKIEAKMASAMAKMNQLK